MLSKMMIKILILVLFMMISMGFFLLIERKLMSLIQFRFGPNKVLFKGMVQFLFDMLKLLFKEQMYLYYFKINFILCLISLLSVSLLFWLLINFNYYLVSNYNYFIILVLLMLIKMLVLSLFLLKYKSMYIQISFVRVIIQFISYDIMIMLVILFILFLIFWLNLIILIFIQKYVTMFNMNFYLVIIWFISLLMEILRLPFDFYESESELISGFNLELGSFSFMLLFMMEYLDMIYFLNLSMMMFFYVTNLMFLILLFLLMVVLWIRSVIIRYRYDKMLNLMWKKLFFFLMLLIILMMVLVSL